MIQGFWASNHARRSLGRGGLLAGRDLAKQIDEDLVSLPRVCREARYHAANVGGVERGVFVDFAGQEALAERAIWHKADSEFLDRRDHFQLQVV